MPKKKRTPKKSFAEILFDKISHLGEGDAGYFDDNSASWVSLRIKDTELHFQFDGKGQNIETIGLYKDKVEVTDQIKVWGN